MPVLYRGARDGSTTADDVEVYVCHTDADGGESELPHVVRHSPTGFNWGYGGSGPADLALSILSHYLGYEPETRLYQRFKEDFVAHWPLERWQLDSETLAAWCTRRGLRPARDPEPLSVYHLRRLLEHYPEVTWHEPHAAEGSDYVAPGHFSPAGAMIPSEPVHEARQWLARYDRLMPGGRELALLERCATLLAGAADGMLAPCSACSPEPMHADELCTQCEAHREALLGTASHVRAFLAALVQELPESHEERVAVLRGIVGPSSHG